MREPNYTPRWDRSFWSNAAEYNKYWTRFHIMLITYHERFGLSMPEEIRIELWQRLVDEYTSSSDSD